MLKTKDLFDLSHSKAAPILGTAASGTIVRVAKVKDDWLCLTDGSYVFYDGGKYAVKV